MKKKAARNRDEFVPITYDIKEKWDKNRKIILVLIVSFIFCFTILYFRIYYLKQHSKKEWSLLGKIWETIIHIDNIETDLKLKDTPDYKNIEKALGDIASLPDWVKKETKDLPFLPVKYLPPNLKEKAIKDYYIKLLEDCLKNDIITSAYPWLIYTLGELYYLNKDFEKAWKYYNILYSEYINHPIYKNLVINQDRIKINEDIKFLSSKSLNYNISLKKEYESNFQAIIYTTKGKFTVNLFDTLYPNLVKTFINFVKTGYYDGLNFYKVTDERIYSGCKLGNGESKPPFTQKVTIKNIFVERGMLVMENYEKEGVIGTKFFILKKFPWNGLNQRYAIIGKIDDENGMSIVDKLKSNDILLKIEIIKKISKDSKKNSV